MRGGGVGRAGVDEVVGVGEGCEEVGQLGGLLRVRPHLCQAGAQQLAVKVQERAARRLPPTHTLKSQMKYNGLTQIVMISNESSKQAGLPQMVRDSSTGGWTRHTTA